MESLALLAAFIISLTVIGGPISLALTFLPQRLLPLAVIKILASLIALMAMLIGIMVVINVNSIGARIMGSFGVITAASAIYRIFKVIPKI
ncbi:MAG: phosphatase [Candidatus Nanopelagicaceae bacterium]|nr:phosphatase [Candidatus Nanopelagicaceae bacterium]